MPSLHALNWCNLLFLINASLIPFNTPKKEQYDMRPIDEIQRDIKKTLRPTNRPYSLSPLIWD